MLARALTGTEIQLRLIEMSPVFSVNQRLFTFCADDGESIQIIIWGPCMQEKRFLILDEGCGATN